MFDYYFSFRSITAAQQAAMELRNQMISVSLLRAPKTISSYGCAFAVRVSFNDGKNAAAFLRKAGISFTKVFMTDSFGAWREAYL